MYIIITMSHIKNNDVQDSLPAKQLVPEEEWMVQLQCTEQSLPASELR